MSVGEQFILVGAAFVLVTAINLLLVRSIATGNAERLERQQHIWPFTYFRGWDADRHEAFLRRRVIPAEFGLGVLLMLVGFAISAASSAL